MPRILFHIHTVYSDGVTTIEDLSEIVSKLKLDAIVILDHARIDGCLALRKHEGIIGTNCKIPIAYEHSVGNTDLALIGVRSVFPSTLSIVDLCLRTKKEGGIVIYLHPFRNNGAHLDELLWLAKNNYIDGYENVNLRDRLDPLPNLRLKQDKIYGLDEHNKIIDSKIPKEAFLWETNSIIWKNILLKDNSKKNQSVYFSDLQMKFDASTIYSCFAGTFHFFCDEKNIFVALSKKSYWPRNFCEESPWTADCFEIAISDGKETSLLYTCYFNEKNELKVLCYSLTNEGILPYNKVLIHTFTSYLSTSHCYILAKNINFKNKFIAFSIGQKAPYPSQERMTWPKPVWPPRTLLDYYIL